MVEGCSVSDRGRQTGPKICLFAAPAVVVCSSRRLTLCVEFVSLCLQSSSILRGVVHLYARGCELRAIVRLDAAHASGTRRRAAAGGSSHSGGAHDCEGSGEREGRRGVRGAGGRKGEVQVGRRVALQSQQQQQRSEGEEPPKRRSDLACPRAVLSSAGASHDPSADHSQTPCTLAAAHSPCSSNDGERIASGSPSSHDRLRHEHKNKAHDTTKRVRTLKPSA